MDNLDNRRKVIRFSFSCDILHRRLGSKDWHSSICDNIGYIGLMFSSDVSYREKQILEIKITFKNTGAQDFSLKGIVMWTLKVQTQTDCYFKTGIQFDSFSENQKKYLDDILTQSHEENQNGPP